jgi:twitching motility protein PilT
MKIEQLLRLMVKEGASDLHLKVGSSPSFRINGDLLSLLKERLTSDSMSQFMNDIMNRVQKNQFEEQKELDFAVGARDLGRFRVNVFRQRGNVAMVIRHISGNIPEFDSLKLPEVILDLALKKRGLILVTGTTGSGKSTALASMVNHINEHISSHILTIEDPIEFVHKDKKSIISQREIGQDTDSYLKSLRAALRQDPDTILVGEIRDLETMSIALTAADTGHMVFSTIHTTNATETISRILSMYPPHQHEEVRHMLANTLVAIISLRLLPNKEGTGRAPAAEIMINTPTIKEYLVDLDKVNLIESAIAEGFDQHRSQTFDQSVYSLLKDDIITYEVAIRNATNPNDFDLKVKGIESTSDRSWM